MLAREEWSLPKVQTDVFSLESLIAWLEKQPAKRAYNYTCNGHCLLSQYFAGAGFIRVHMESRRFYHAGGTEELPGGFDDVAGGLPGFSMALTFGAALKRARSIQKSAVSTRERRL